MTEILYAYAIADWKHGFENKISQQLLTAVKMRNSWILLRRINEKGERSLRKSTYLNINLFIFQNN